MMAGRYSSTYLLIILPGHPDQSMTSKDKNHTHLDTFPNIDSLKEKKKSSSLSSITFKLRSLERSPHILQLK